MMTLFLMPFLLVFGMFLRCDGTATGRMSKPRRLWLPLVHLTTHTLSLQNTGRPAYVRYGFVDLGRGCVARPPLTVDAGVYEAS